jgi:mono/diheme cytochrome c family protein
MNETKKKLAFVFATVVAFGVYFSSAPALRAQDRPGSNPTGADAKLTQQQFKGQGLFLQRCSLCHQARNLKFGTPPTVGPSLKNAFKNVSGDEEKDLRTFILNGSPHMPGFQYSLSSKEIDDLVGYLKVM